MLVGEQIVESQVEIDCQSLGLSEVHQCDSVESVLNHWAYFVELVPGVFAKERYYSFLLFDKAVNGFYLDTLFVGALVIVLVLDFEECHL